MTQRTGNDNQTLRSLALRKVLGQFATGIAVVMTKDHRGCDYGMTINSFSSVSLEPPLVLWSIARTSPSFQAFAESPSFTISILNNNQKHLSAQFAKASDNKFQNVACRQSMLGPLYLEDALAHFECAVHARYDGGDHLILIGDVKHFSASEGQPLIFHRGAYCALNTLPV